MQARIKRLIDDRTQALAAVSHDLKTPLTRLRLKSEGLKDKALATSIRGDLTEMEAMLDQTLAYLSGDRTDESMRPLDLMALIQTLADEASDAGADVSVAGVERTSIEGRPLALRRALGNLIANAVKYGERARVSVRGAAGSAIITIDDDGPGIPDGGVERAFQPFQRLEQSRSKDTGGFGLGLTIARTIVVGHGGSLTLTNRPEGGLTATVVLPVKAATLASA
jgi:two-component system, OmpR family, sensor kinase